MPSLPSDQVRAPEVAAQEQGKDVDEVGVEGGVQDGDVDAVANL